MASRLTQTLVGLVGGGSPPGSVVVEGFADVAVVALRVVFAVTHQASAAVLHALAGVAVTLAPDGTETHTCDIRKSDDHLKLFFQGQ